MSILDDIDLQSIDLKTPTSSSGSFYFTKAFIRRKQRLGTSVANWCSEKRM